MIERNNGASQSDQMVDEMLDQMKPAITEAVENFESDEIQEIENIDDLTVEDFYNSKMNKAFNAHNSENFFLTPEGKIGFKCTIYDEPENVIGEYDFVRDSLGKAFEDYNVVMLAMVAEVQDQFIEFRITPVVDVFFQSFRDKISNEKLEDIDARSDKLYYKKIRGTKGLDAVLDAINHMDED